MPRRARRESATGFYHIVSRGLDREDIFGEKREKTMTVRPDSIAPCIHIWEVVPVQECSSIRMGMT